MNLAKQPPSDMQPQNVVLALNIGSSSIKSVLYSDRLLPLLESRLVGIGTPQIHLSIRRPSDNVQVYQEDFTSASCGSFHELIERFLESIKRFLVPTHRLQAVVHRVVHGGDRHSPVVLSEAVRLELACLIPLAPLHQEENLSGIDLAGQYFPESIQVACFDTAFHRGHPKVADMYAIPLEYYDSGIRRYGFHGLSNEGVCLELRSEHPTLARSRIVIAHLGSGASLTAVKDGQSVACTMGFSTLDGVAMGTRCGQIDPGVLLYLLQERKVGVSQLSDLLYRQSGLLGLSGISSDMAVLLSSAESRAKEAIEYFIADIVKSIGQLAATMEGVDGIVFTGGIGEHATTIRTRILERLHWLGLRLSSPFGPVLTSPESSITALVIPANEELVLARHAFALLSNQP